MPVFVLCDAWFVASFNSFSLVDFLSVCVQVASAPTVFQVSGKFCSQPIIIDMYI